MPSGFTISNNRIYYRKKRSQQAQWWLQDTSTTIEISSNKTCCNSSSDNDINSSNSRCIIIIFISLYQPHGTCTKISALLAAAVTVATAASRRLLPSLAALKANLLLHPGQTLLPSVVGLLLLHRGHHAQHRLLRLHRQARQKRRLRSGKWCDLERFTNKLQGDTKNRFCFGQI